MANFERSGMTQAGINLMGKAIGGATIQFTKLVLGDGEITGEILNLQGVVSPKQNVDVTRIERNDNQCTVGGELLTRYVKQGFFWRECGLYAMDPDEGEILYNYAYSSKPDYIAASDSGMMEEILVSMVATVGSNTNVNVTLDDSMVFATKKQIDNIQTELNNLALNVRNFGAKGDGIYDDTISIQNAIDYLNEQGGGTLFIPKGVYLIKDSTEYKGLRPCANLTIKGELGTVLKLGSRVCNIISNFIGDFYPNKYSDIENVVIENIEFDSNGDVLGDPCSGEYTLGDNYSFGTYIVKAKNITIRNCIFKNSYYGGINLFGVDGQNIVNCYFENIGMYDDAYYKSYSAFGSDSTRTFPSRNIIIRDNTVKNCGSVFRANGGLNNDDTLAFENVEFYGNYFYECDKGVMIFGSSVINNIRFINNYSENIMSRVFSVSSEGSTWGRKSKTYDIKIFGNSVFIDKLNMVENTSLFYIESDTISIFQANDIEITQPYGEFNKIITYIDTCKNNTIKSSHIESNNFKIKQCQYLVFNSNGSGVVFRGNNVEVETCIKLFRATVIDELNILMADSNVFKVDNTKMYEGSWNKKMVRNNQGYITSFYGKANVRDGDIISAGLNCYNNVPPVVNLQVATENYNTFISYSTTAQGELIIHLKNSNGESITTPKSICYSTFSWDYLGID